MRRNNDAGIAIIVIAILCASCRTDAQLDPIQTTPIIDAAEINAREDCLYREVARLLEAKGSPLISLQNAAVTATRFCSEAIRIRFQRASVSAPDAQNLTRDDQVKTPCLRHRFGITRERDRYRSGGQLTVLDRSQMANEIVFLLPMFPQPADRASA